jgi:hypothetical protein
MVEYRGLGGAEGPWEIEGAGFYNTYEPIGTIRTGYGGGSADTGSGFTAGGGL